MKALPRMICDGVNWLYQVSPSFFPDANFKIDIEPAMDEEEFDLLSLVVYGQFSAREFSERRYRLCQAMRTAGHQELYDIIGIFQRRCPPMNVTIRGVENAYTKAGRGAG